MPRNWNCEPPGNFDVHQFFGAVIRQDAEQLRKFFEPDALIVWANTNEQFTVDEYIRANCEYPGTWSGKIETLDIIDGYERRIVVVSKVWNAGGDASRAVSFIKFGDTEDGLIQLLAEYWSEIGTPPEWRREMGIGTIHVQAEGAAK